MRLGLARFKGCSVLHPKRRKSWPGRTRGGRRDKMKKKRKKRKRKRKERKKKKKKKRSRRRRKLLLNKDAGQRLHIKRQDF